MSPPSLTDYMLWFLVSLPYLLSMFLFSGVFLAVVEVRFWYKTELDSRIVAGVYILMMLS